MRELIVVKQICTSFELVVALLPSILSASAVYVPLLAEVYVIPIVALREYFCTLKLLLSRQ